MGFRPVSESIYNCYTGIGGCTSPRMKYAGTWWICCVLSHPKWFLTCCGMGNFFNHLPNPHNALTST